MDGHNIPSPQPVLAIIVTHGENKLFFKKPVRQNQLFKRPRSNIGMYKDMNYKITYKAKFQMYFTEEAKKYIHKIK